MRGKMILSGSSPRAWGKEIACVTTRSGTRIIPTCVGKREAESPVPSLASDHPHVRGEKHRRALFPRGWHGSSPRAWGKAPLGLGVGEPCRIIPTCVGKSSVCHFFHFVSPDHPHVRGEKLALSPVPTTLTGSSPRAWGKGVEGDSPPLPARIIPTCVGKRMFGCDGSSVISDHPHVRGEKRRRGRRGPTNGGSSPRAWGKGILSGILFMVFRIIPTCVGKRHAGLPF